MRKIALTVLMTGMVMNAYGAEEGESFNDGRLPLSSLTTQHNRSPYKGPYPECSQYIQYEKDESRKVGIEKGRQQEKLVIATRMFKKGGIYTPKFIEEITDITEEQLREALAKEEHK